MKLQELSERLTAEVRPRSFRARQLMAGFGLVYVALSLLSVMVHIINIRTWLADAIEQGGDLGFLNDGYVNYVSGLLYHVPFVVAGLASAVIFFFPDKLGYVISFLTLHCAGAIYWRWDSWSTGMRSEFMGFSEQVPIGATVFTRGLLMLLAVLLMYETAVLIKVLFFCGKSE